MGKHLLSLLVVLLVVFSVEARKSRSLRRGVQEEINQKRDTTATYPPFQTFNQTLDHFNLLDTRTFSQRYVNESFWDGTGPVFFMIGDEAALSGSHVVTYQMALWGAQFKALLVSLEHRYFGSSQPFSDVSTESLAYFSVDQVLADCATFTEVIRKQYNAKNSQFIIFGGSYGGMLASWFRLKYPQIADAAVASSATVEVIADYYQYLEVVTAVITATSPVCALNILQATNRVQPLTKTSAGLAQLSKMFNICPPLVPADVPNFMQYLAYWWMYTAQYNLQSQGTNISSLCDIMTNPRQDALTNYIEVWNVFSGGECIDASLASYVADLNDTSVNNDGDRQFYWMQCFFQGFFGTSDSKKQVFGNEFDISIKKCLTNRNCNRSLINIHLASQTQICPWIFGGREFNPARLDWTLLNFGGNTPATSRIIYVNGDKDPYYRAGITTAPHGAKYKTLFIHGASHCADMHPAKPYSPPALVPAQNKILHQLEDWVEEYNRLHAINH